jgi:hypothetical protein
MNNVVNVSKYKDIYDNIINIDDNYIDKTLKLNYKTEPCKIINIIKFLNNTDYKNFKFNQYSIKKYNDDNYVIILNYEIKK